MKYLTEEEIFQEIRPFVEEDSGFTLVYNPAIETKYARYRPDGLIRRGKEDIAFVEYKPNISPFSRDVFFDKIRPSLKENNICFFLLIKSLDQCYIYRLMPGVISSFMVTVKEAISIIKRICGIKVKAEDNEKDIILKEYLNFLHNLKNICDISDKSVSEFLGGLNEDDLEYDDFAVSLSCEKETEFFRRLLWQDKPWQQLLTKYGTLSSLYRILNEKKQSLASIVNMNDKSECDLFDRMLEDDILANYNITTERKTNCFIISMVKLELADKLTQWRLYGDDSKGVSVTYNMGEELFFDRDGFYVAPICYVEIDKKNKAIKTWEARLLMELLHRKINGVPFVFKKWDAWKHFFKPDDYKIEEEYRILYYRDYETAKKPPLKWIHDGTTNIVFPVVEFYLRQEDYAKESEEKQRAYSVFPFSIDSVLLGINMPELVTNVEELRYLAKYNLDMDLPISSSNITDYRS